MSVFFLFLSLLVDFLYTNAPTEPKPCRVEPYQIKIMYYAIQRKKNVFLHTIIWMLFLCYCHLYGYQLYKNDNEHYHFHLNIVCFVGIRCLVFPNEWMKYTACKQVFDWMVWRAAINSICDLIGLSISLILLDKRLIQALNEPVNIEIVGKMIRLILVGWLITFCVSLWLILISFLSVCLIGLGVFYFCSIMMNLHR